MADRKQSQHFLILICCISLCHDTKDTSRAKKADKDSFGQCWNRTTCTGRWGGCRRRGWTRCPPPWLRLDLNIRIKCFHDASDKTSNHKIFSSPAFTLPTYSPLFFFKSIPQSGDDGGRLRAPKPEFLHVFDCIQQPITFSRVSWVCENVCVQHNQKATVDSVLCGNRKI